MFRILLLCFFVCSCSNKSDEKSGGPSASSKIVIKPESDRFVEDESQNDNLNIIRQECYLKPNGPRKVELYFSSELHGPGNFIEDSFYIPSADKFDSNNEYKESYSASSCNAAGLRNLQGNSLEEAIAGFKFTYLYGCGGSCAFKLENKTLDSNGYYLSVKFSYVCTNVMKNRLAQVGPYGDVVDKISGLVNCESSK